jgi:hypothetical protein
LDLDQDWLEPDLDASYVPAQALFAGQPTVFWPKTGWLTRPRVVYERRP